MLNQENFLNSLLSSSCFQQVAEADISSAIAANVFPQNIFPDKFNRYVVSCSGGLDSMVLLHLMASMQQILFDQGIKLAAIYVNHNLSPHAQEWAEFCQVECLKYQIPLSVLSVNAKPAPRQSPEAAARDARYGAIKKILKRGDALLTGHHQNDQVETLLLQLLRGSGPKGLAAMPVCRDFADFHLLRPLLNFSREGIKNYAIQYQLKWVEDESNQQQKFKRNFLRHSILPKLQQQWPGFASSLSRVSLLQSEAVEILEEVASEDLKNCTIELNVQQKDMLSFNPAILKQALLDTARLQKLSSGRIKNGIQFWLRSNQVAVLNAKLLQQFLDIFINKATTANSLLNWKFEQQHYQIRYYQNRLYLLNIKSNPTEPEQTRADVLWNFKKHSKITFGKFTMEIKEPDQLAKELLSDTLKLCFRKGGERFKKNHSSRHFLLKKWFQEQSIPPWLRSQIPLFYNNEQLIQVGNIVVNRDYKAKSNEAAIAIIVRLE
ncbi:MAG: tRNA lysidine(34) synthetase TilS [Pseudomonadota bacterium]